MAIAPIPAHGRIYSVFSTKGGCGRTTVATNLAFALHADGARRVCLLDLDLGFGDVATALRLDPDHTLAGVLRMIEPHTAKLRTSIRPGLDAILAPVGPGDAERISAEQVTAVLDQLVDEYDAIVVDTPARFTGPVLAALDCSTQHILLTTPERPALLNLRRTLDSMDLLRYPLAARTIVFNRSDSRVGITVADVERILRATVAVHIPSSRDVPTSINHGVPLVAAAAKHPVSLAVRQLAELSLHSPPRAGAPTDPIANP
jgi:pilus assembly protein CpaE